MNLFYILLLIILPISAYILIHKIILEKYYELQFMRQNNILFYDFFKLFFAGYTPFIIFRYLCLVLGIKTKAGYINLLIIFKQTCFAILIFDYCPYKSFDIFGIFLICK